MTNITRAAYASAVVFAAACAHPAAPRVQPEPAPVPPSSAPAAQTPPPIAQTSAPMKSRPASKRADSARVLATDVARRSVDAFGDRASPSADEADSAPSWDIDVESYASEARVERYVRMFSGPAKERIQSRLARGTQYEAMIRSKLREGGVPEDMYYLALIESGFDPNAYSRAAAVGMWQFMTSTGRDMGLRIDWWIDERRDPFKSTTAAVRFIKGLNAQFGSLYLAAAAYNGGPGRVSRGLSRYADDLEGTSGDDLFFALADRDYFRNETREYVPQLIAAALIAKDPERYGMEFETLPAITYDSVRVGPATPIPAIALASKQRVRDVLELNPHVLRGITPLADSFFVRLPSGMADSFPAAYEALPAGDRVGLRAVASMKGETVATIARREGLNARELGFYNPKLKLLKNGTLAPEQTVFVPTAAIANAAVAVPDPAIERYSSTRASSTHVVKPGETLSGIATHYHTSTAALMKSNGLKRPLIFPGQSLVVEGHASSTPVVASKSTAKSIVASESTAPSNVAVTSTAKSIAASKSTSKSTVATAAKLPTPAESSVASKPVASKSVASKSVASKSVAPKSVASKSVASKSVAPKSVAPKSVAPKSSATSKLAKTTTKPQPKTTSAKPKTTSKPTTKRID